MSRFDDRDREQAPEGAARELDLDAPGVDVAGPAAVGQSAELLDAGPATAERAGVTAAPVPSTPQPMPQPVQRLAESAPAPAVQVSPDGSGGGGAAQRSGRGAAAIIEVRGDGAAAAAAQLRAADPARFDALLDEPAARTPVALRGRKRRRSAATPEQATPESQPSHESADEAREGST